MDSEDFPRGKVPPAVANAGIAEREAKRTSTSGIRLGDKKSKDKMENLFANTDAVTSTKKKVKRQKKLTPEEERLISGKRFKSAEKEFFQVVPLSYDQLIQDMMALGVVHDILNDGLLIILPGRATGKVCVTDISDPYTKLLKRKLIALEKGRKYDFFHGHNEMFKVGQLVSVKITGIGQKSNGHTDVKLSMNPKDIHANYNSSMITTNLVLVGAIVSKEDKGFQVDLGVENVVAFLNINEVPKKHASLRVGELIYCKVTHVTQDKSQRRTVKVSMNIGNSESQPCNDGTAVSVSALLPGMMLNGIVEKSHETGLRLNCYSFTGLVHSDHMRNEWTLSQSITEASEVFARVLYINPNLTTPYLTLQTDLVPIKTFLTGEDRSKLGSLQIARVVNATNRGVIVRFAEGNEKGFISLNHLGDGPLTSSEEIAKKFKNNSELQCRILKYAPFERMYLCSVNKDYLKETLTNIQQVKAGDMVECKIVTVNAGGVEVSFGRNLVGFIPNSLVGHNKWVLKSDSSINRTVKGKIIEVDLDRKRVILSINRQLVKSKGTVISSLSNAKIGQLAHVIVTRVCKNGVTVKTIGGVKGFIPVSKLMNNKAVTDCTEYVKVTDILWCKVHKVESDQVIMEVATNDDEVEKLYESKKSNKKKCQEKLTEECEEMDDTVEIKKSNTKRTKTEKAVGNFECQNANDGENGKQKRVKKRRKNKKKSQMDEVLKTINSHKDDNTSSEDYSGTQDVKEEVDDPNNSDSDQNIVHTLDDEIGKRLSSNNLGGLWNSIDIAETFEDKALLLEKNPKMKKTEAIQSKEKDVNLSSDAKTASFKLSDADSSKKYEKYLHPDKADEAKEAHYWIEKMSSYSSEGYYDKARCVAQEALDYGPIAQNSQEAFKVWKALFLLELKFGDKESAKAIMLKAVQRTDDKYACYKMAAVAYEKQGHIKEAVDIYRNYITRECAGMVDGWINFARLYFEQGDLENARNVYHTASKQISSHNLNGANLTSRFAILEIYHGDISKGSLMLDQFLQLHPHRVDIWLVYIQALIKKEEFDRTRAVFQRAFEVDWKPQKIKGLLNHYKTFENMYGNEATRSNFVSTALRVLGPSGLNVLS